MAIWGNSDDAKHLGCIISRAAPHRKVFDEKMTGPGRALKRSKLKAISHGFRRPRYPCSECSGMYRGDVGWYIKDFHDFERA